MIHSYSTAYMAINMLTRMHQLNVSRVNMRSAHRLQVMLYGTMQDPMVSFASGSVSYESATHMSC